MRAVLSSEPVQPIHNNNQKSKKHSSEAEVFVAVVFAAVAASRSANTFLLSLFRQVTHYVFDFWILVGLKIM